MITEGDTAAKITTAQLLPLVVSSPCPGLCLLRVSGELDLLTQPRLVSCVHDLLRARPSHLVLDLSRVRFMGTSGLQALVCARDACARCGSELHVTGTGHNPVARPLKLLGLDRVFTIYPNVAEALAMIGNCAEAPKAG